MYCIGLAICKRRLGVVDFGCVVTLREVNIECW